MSNRGVSEGGAGGAIAPPLFGRIEGAAGSGATPHYYLYYYLPPHFYEATYAPAFIREVRVCHILPQKSILD